ncbi:hypothetical protein [Hymenobacter sp. BRD67]|uniref:hypothetical protein n=1 Tax=Hymenobacter sp. BRD67 TaxID=2675877 RepID=UPI001565C948|nr:hypothetical protein [Hymenobacter sp. BRD67]QKG53185.1 hypothetical protein GKZ67_12005 [Hymenobacter sp. BRD67]
MSSLPTPLPPGFDDSTLAQLADGLNGSQLLWLSGYFYGRATGTPAGAGTTAATAAPPAPAAVAPRSPFSTARTPAMAPRWPARPPKPPVSAASRPRCRT